ncbi:Protein kinase superfamily protein [Prunus dulcis]|uniref:Protein kinase superfamily protein n=1 Tax=Prunus dulcis TaxID=3755 RepID=A0A4Y1R1S8_PRUDU|nr:Protein kinase superfamily protein [Prunus dulcis]
MLRRCSAAILEEKRAFRCRVGSQEDMIEKGDLGCLDYEKFLFPMVPPPPPVRIPASFRRSEVPGAENARDRARRKTMKFTNPYGIRSTSPSGSKASSDRFSQFGTARDYHDFDMQNDLFWHDEKDDGDFMTPCFEGPDFFACPSEDKYIMTSDTDKQNENLPGLNFKSEAFQSDISLDYLDKNCLTNISPVDDKSELYVTDHYNFDKKNNLEGGFEEEPEDVLPLLLQSTFTIAVLGDIPPTDIGSATNHRISKSSKNDRVENFKGSSGLDGKVVEKDFMQKGIDGYGVGDSEVNEEPCEPEAAADGDGVDTDEVLIYNANEDEYEVFELRIIHRKNRTGFEENKDFPIVLKTVIASRYYITEYIGSAAFSKVVQAHDLHTGVDVCLKIIKNDKEFFDQSLDEIKLLKFVNKNDPGDEHHILRLYDYFYHQEHLFIVCELLRANLYEFQKFSQESGGEAYFTIRRLQVITRQCLEALDYLHHLGIIHCDLKPENILIKSYRRCEIKIIDLGSSCFRTDNLCLYVQSRSYRAPEVILGLPYDEKIDMWSLGCILAELCSGEVLFPNDAIVMILARMIGMLGPIDLDMLVRGQETDKYFTNELDLYHINEETSQLEYIIPEESSLENHLQVTDVGFIDFVKSLVEVNPERRPTAREAMEHPWLSYTYESSPF